MRPAAGCLLKGYTAVIISNEKKGKVNKIQELVYELKVKDVMKPNVITVGPETLMSELRTVLREKRISGTPVVKEGRLLGVISMEDFINWLSEGGEDYPLEN